MKFALSDDQRMFQASVRRYLEGASPLDRVREAADGDRGVAEVVSRGLSELGAGQILVPEAYEGLGLGLLDAALVQEALGAAVAPAGHLASTMAVAGILQAGSAAQQAEWLARIASGEVRIGVAIGEHVGAREGAGVTAVGGKLTGKSLFALESDGASHVVVCDRDGGLHIADMSDAGLTRTELETIDRTRDYGELVFDGVAAT
ncbi:MAG: acyl-CoA dehydrogenase family protein, partial [Henriciella sp.]|nr:acyl-CoA dehydrogenase family protein [Henriciella sp.]